MAVFNFHCERCARGLYIITHIRVPYIIEWTEVCALTVVYTPDWLVHTFNTSICKVGIAKQ